MKTVTRANYLKAFIGAALCCAAMANFTEARELAASSFVDDAHRTISVPKKIARTFAAGAPAEVLLYTLAPETMVGRNHLPVKEALEFMPPELRSPLLISKLPRAQDASNDAELVALKPDLYVDYGDLHEDYVKSVSHVQERTGIASIILDGSLDKIPSTYRRLGALLNLRSRGDVLAKEIERLFKKYRGALSKTGIAPRVYLACSGDGLIPCLAGEKNGEAAQFLGADNVAGSVGAPIKPMSVEDIQRWNPDIIIAANIDSAARLLKDPTWQAIAAIKTKRVYAPPTLPFNWGSRPPSVNRVVGMIWLRYTLANKAFDTDFYTDVRSFYKLFYHVTPTDEQLARLVGPVG